MGGEAPQNASARPFTLEEANATLPNVIPLLEALRDAHAVMEKLHDRVMESVPTNGGGETHQSFIDASGEAAKAMHHLNKLGVVVRDPANGLIDFPTVHDGREAFLCWKLGEGESIAFWHPPETGFAGRRPVEG